MRNRRFAVFATALMVGATPAYSFAGEVNVSVDVGNHGSVNNHSDDYAEKVAEDASYELKIKADDGYEIHSVLINDEPVSDYIADPVEGQKEAEITVGDVGGDMDVSAVFRATSTVTGTYIDESGGTGTAEGSSTSTGNSSNGDAVKDGAVSKTTSTSTGTNTGTATANDGTRNGTTADDDDGSNGTDTGDGSATGDGASVGGTGDTGDGSATGDGASVSGTGDTGDGSTTGDGASVGGTDGTGDSKSVDGAGATTGSTDQGSGTTAGNKDQGAGATTGNTAAGNKTAAAGGSASDDRTSGQGVESEETTTYYSANADTPDPVEDSRSYESNGESETSNDTHKGSGSPKTGDTGLPPTIVAMALLWSVLMTVGLKVVRRRS